MPFRKKGQPLQTKTFETRALAEQWARAIEVEMDKGVFVSRAEAESTTLKELLDRYLDEVTPLKKGAASETNHLRALMRLPLTRRYVAGIRGMDIARYRDERLRGTGKPSPASPPRLLNAPTSARYAVPASRIYASMICATKLLRGCSKKG